ncbi:helix-turn-helix domain-containing protein [Lysinibacillus pakistanensis]|uniref:Helix-turn-helix transcriptional regulator n=1 Tax=Lysinibacillus pakistanensis TaxID=759811 RepID=A0AAX3WW82_9BACI|nr:helix-turn-helix transcriptional regulator [Lysinibacillus pakistanensis]MDM5231578.1 helix-turn-helix transcriptional regulator [Lysinibacillus pakistanensis]WHY47123.1 helix-turn-helix transcriptional regulator [Lysinibacillus pakistanensis]WHY52133.1 helix-turn-helix transcriptional regulator [Lysinibacillus pakistanensis]
MSFKVHLSKLLGERKMKISDLVNATGLHRNGLSKLYNENTDGIKFETLEKICKALNCEIADLLEIILAIIKSNHISAAA